MTLPLERSGRWIALTLFALGLAGCASSKPDTIDAQRHYAAGYEEAFALLQRSGIDVVRLNGPFQRPLVKWQPQMTVAEAIVEGGYLEERDPTQIIIQRGPASLPVDPAALLSGEDVPVQSGDIIHVLP